MQLEGIWRRFKLLIIFPVYAKLVQPQRYHGYILLELQQITGSYRLIRIVLKAK